MWTIPYDPSHLHAWQGVSELDGGSKSATTAGFHFGYPHYHGFDLIDSQFDFSNACANFTKPELLLESHVAALGMEFYEGTQFPGFYRNPSGWLQANGEAWGQPVDVEVMADGSLLVSDDEADVIYRISYHGNP